MQPVMFEPSQLRPSVLAEHLLLSENFHRTANDLAVACAEVHVASRMIADESVRAGLTLAADKLRALSALQRLLQPPSEPSLDLGSAVSKLCALNADARFSAQDVLVRLRTDEIVLDGRRGWGVLMILSELLVNAARHAFDAGGTVHVDVVQRQGRIACVVSDDGKGVAPQRLEARCQGSAIVEQLAREIGAAVRLIPSRVGTVMEVELPLDHD